MTRTACVLLIAILAAGCGPREETVFRLNEEGRRVDSITIRQRDAIDETMREWFGTGDDPKAPEVADIDLALVRRAAGPIGRDIDGRPRGLFRQYCATCHGVSGDGAGPIAMLFDPYPRDFRDGLYKYTSTVATARATDDDLRRTLREGLAATGMPAFPTLSDQDVDALVEYLRWLGARGETEQFLTAYVADDNASLPLKSYQKDEVLDDITRWSTEQWRDAESRVIEAPTFDVDIAPAESIARGRELYLSERAQCESCHGPEGRGDGDTTDVFDEWNRPKNSAADDVRFTLPIQQLRPRDFRDGVFRGGADDADLYRRIHAGVKGTPMPGAGKTDRLDAVLTDDEIRDVMNYVRSLGE